MKVIDENENIDKKANNIALIGFMATGKTTMARELGKSLGRQYFDIDSLIEDEMNMSISEIFAKYGEEYFRELEKKIIKETSGLENIVISYGGGVCLDPENVINIKKKGKVVLLEADPETILNRTKRDSSRPLLNNKDNVDSIKSIMDARRDSYHSTADIIIDTIGKNIVEVRDEILKEISL